MKEDDDEKKNNDSNKTSKITINDTLTATNGKTVKSSIVFIAAFKHLHNLAKTLLQRKRIKNIKDDEIQWIITVPAIWNDEAKYRMRQWTIDAGLVNPEIDNQCKIVYEPDCASLSIQHHIQQSKRIVSNVTDDKDNDNDDHKTMENNKSTTNFTKGEKYILVDAGGGTVDIACHEILDEFGIKEILHPSGGPWGSCYIDDQFIQLLTQIFDNKYIEEFKTKKPNIWTQIMHNFQKSKKTFYQNTEAVRHNVRLPIEFIAFMQDKFESNEQDLEEIIPKKIIFSKKAVVSLNNEFLEIDSFIWKLMFDHVITPTIEHIKQLLSEPKLMRNCKYLCLVGGLSTSPYFKNKMEKEFGIKSKYKMIVIQPTRPLLSVVEGAAYFGITKNYVKARVLRYTYGTVVNFKESQAKKLGVPLEHIMRNSKSGKVKGCFKIIAKKNEEIYTGEIRKNIGYRPGGCSYKVYTKVIYSEMEDPKCVSDGVILGVVTTTYNEHDSEHEEGIVEFHFYDTMIKTVVYNRRSPHLKQTHYISNY